MQIFRNNINNPYNSAINIAQSHLYGFMRSVLDAVTRLIFSTWRNKKMGNNEDEVQRTAKTQVAVSLIGQACAFCVGPMDFSLLVFSENLCYF